MLGSACPRRTYASFHAEEKVRLAQLELSGDALVRTKVPPVRHSAIRALTRHRRVRAACDIKR